MKNKKKITIKSAIACLVLLLILIGASFAYFGMFTVNLENKVAVNIYANDIGNTSFIATSANLNVIVPKSGMFKGNTGLAAENTATLTVNLTGAPNVTTTCTYDVVYEYNLDSEIYGNTVNVTSGATKEITMQVESPSGTNSYVNETNFAYDSSWTPKTSTVGAKKILVKGATIKSSGTSTIQDINITGRYYNLNLDQSQLVDKSFTGTIYVENNSCTVEELEPTLYNAIAKRYNANDEYVKLYNGADYGDTTTYANNIYYFDGNVENNNVLFANYCWKIVRTTDTGGVKIVYNGVQKDFYTSESLSQSEYVNLSNDATYPYTFDETNKMWTSTNTGTNSSTISFTAPSNGDYVINYDLSMNDYEYGINVEIFKDNVSQGKFTGTDNGQIVFKNLTTSNVIKIIYTRKYSWTIGDRNNVIFSFGRVNSIIKSCNNIGDNSQIGTTLFNSNYNSPAYVGYMYNENKVYTPSSKAIVNNEYFDGTKAYADAVIYDSSMSKYTLDSATATTLNVTWSNISSLVGKYTCSSSSITETCTNVYYIVGYKSNYIYYYSLSKGDVDGTDNGSNYVFGSSFTYNGTYTLTDTVTINSDTWSTSSTNVNTHHYTCLTNGNSCTSVYYVYYDSNGTLYYITLTGGKSVNDALNEMLYNDDVNTKDSTIKAYIDSWYEENIKDKYDDRLEDTVFCNDRSMDNESQNGWNPNGGSTTTELQFKNYSLRNKSLVCANETDRFSVNNPKARLKYPIGLLTAPELSLAGYSNSNGHYFDNGQNVFLSSPYRFGINTSAVLGVSSSSWNENVGREGGVRSAVSIKPGTEISSGDGSYTNPFVIE